MPAAAIDLDKLRLVLRRMTRGELLIIAERAIERLPATKLKEVVRDRVHLADKASTETSPSLLQQAQKLHDAARQRAYWDPFDVNWRNSTAVKGRRGHRSLEDELMILESRGWSRFAGAAVVVLLGLAGCGGVASKVPGLAAVMRGPEDVAKDYAVAEVTRNCEKAGKLVLPEEVKLLGKPQDMWCGGKDTKEFLDAAAAFVDTRTVSKHELSGGIVEVEIETKAPELDRIIGTSLMSGKDPREALKGAAKTQTDTHTVQVEKGPDGAWMVVHGHELARVRLGARYVADKKLIAKDLRIDRQYGRIRGSLQNHADRSIESIEGKVYMLDASGGRIGEGQFRFQNEVLPGEAREFRVLDRDLPSEAKSVDVEWTKVEPASLFDPDFISKEERDRAAKYLGSVEVQITWSGKNSEREGIHMGGDHRLVAGKIKNKGAETVAVVQARLDFMDAQGKPVASYVFDPLSTSPRGIWKGDAPLKAGYVKEFEVDLGAEGPEGWAKTLASVKVTPVAVAFSTGEKDEQE